MNSKLYIGNVAPTVTEEDLRVLFSQAGAVTAVKLIVDAATHQSRGYAFVTMATAESAATALRDLHCHELGGRQITVSEARVAQSPRGLMSEGFDPQSSAQFRPRADSRKSRNRHPRPGAR